MYWQYFPASEKEADEDEDEDEFPEIAPAKPSSEEVALHTYIHAYIDFTSWLWVVV